MAFSRHFLRQHDFAFTQCHGVIDDNSLRIHLLCFGIEAQGMTTIRELADARGIEKANKATVSGLVELAQLDKERSAGRKEYLAIVVTRPLIYEMFRLYADSVRAGKQDIGIFHKPSQALSWLGYDGPEVSQLHRFMNKHRVKGSPISPIPSRFVPNKY
jgi:hypothetical protein